MAWSYRRVFLGRGRGRRLLRGLRVLGRLLVRLLLRGSNGGPLRSRRLLCHLFRVLLGLDLLRQLLGRLLGLEGLVAEVLRDEDRDAEALSVGVATLCTREGVGSHRGDGFGGDRESIKRC